MSVPTTDTPHSAATDTPIAPQPVPTSTTRGSTPRAPPARDGGDAQLNQQLCLRSWDQRPRDRSQTFARRTRARRASTRSAPTPPGAPPADGTPLPRQPPRASRDAPATPPAPRPDVTQQQLRLQPATRHPARCQQTRRVAQQPTGLHSCPSPLISARPRRQLAMGPSGGAAVRRPPPRSRWRPPRPARRSADPAGPPARGPGCTASARCDDR